VTLDERHRDAVVVFEAKWGPKRVMLGDAHERE
jgi:hypothetical protein